MGVGGWVDVGFASILALFFYILGVGKNIS